MRGKEVYLLNTHCGAHTILDMATKPVENRRGPCPCECTLSRRCVYAGRKTAGERRGILRGSEGKANSKEIVEGCVQQDDKTGEQPRGGRKHVKQWRGTPGEDSTVGWAGETWVRPLSVEESGRGPGWGWELRLWEPVTRPMGWKGDDKVKIHWIWDVYGMDK